MAGKEIKKYFHRDHFGWKPEVDKFFQMGSKEVRHGYTNWGYPVDCCSNTMTIVNAYCRYIAISKT